MAAGDGASSISVTVRVRPFTIKEAAQLTKCDDGPLFLGEGSLAAVPTPKLTQKGVRPVIKVVDERCLVFDPPEDSPVQRFSRSVVPQGRRVKDQTFAFDRVFDDNTTQGDVYAATTRNLLDSVLDGYNATVFAYGATGCGKTHTITGTAQDPGIIFLTMQELFERIGDLQGEKATEISLSYLEIYNETIRDLLVPGGSKAGLMLREDAHQTVSVAGLSSHHPHDVSEVMNLIIQGNEYRTMSPTAANATSSRSHAVLQINVTQKDRNADVNEPHTMATLSIIDLAGSERASATKNRGERLLEGANINKSLLALGSCINALCDPHKRNHVPYRNSKLTRLLKFSLGGNCKTVMIVCVSPSSQHFDETQNTLRYANRAKNIQTKVTRNVFNVNRHVKDFLKKIDEQMALIKELQEQQKDAEGMAFVKFRKLGDKREGVLREGVTRLRNAYDHSSADRQERTNSMKKLRQIERRIASIQAWLATFEGVCEARENEEPPAALTALRKQGQGVLAELEGSRQHYHQRLSKVSWQRALDTALQLGLQQLHEAECEVQGPECLSLQREAELLKAEAEREAYAAVLDFDKAGDTALMQVLLHAHFDSAAMMNQLLQMEEEAAVLAAKTNLHKMLTASCEATSRLIKADGSLAITEMLPPSRAGTPKRRKNADLLGPSPMKPQFALVTAPEPLPPVTLPSIRASPSKMMSPMKMSPRRRVMGSAKRGISFTPKKKSPLKRAVRWRDDMEDGTLAEYEKTPQRLDSTPDVSPSEMPPSPVPQAMSAADIADTDSSPIPEPPVSQVALPTKPRSSRFEAGFLSKRGNGSPIAPGTLSSAAPVSSSSAEPSPLQEIEHNKVSGRFSVQHGSPLSKLQNTAESENTSGSDSEKDLTASKPDSKSHNNASAFNEAARRISIARSASLKDANRAAAHRRRSPPSSSASRSCSPAHSENAMFTASQARRMVRSERDGEWRNSVSVLSPHSTSISKHGHSSSVGGTPVGGMNGVAGRRTTLGDERGGLQRAHSISRASNARLSALAGVAATPHRGSLVAGGKGAWR